MDGMLWDGWLLDSSSMLLVSLGETAEEQHSLEVTVTNLCTGCMMWSEPMTTTIPDYTTECPATEDYLSTGLHVIGPATGEFVDVQLYWSGTTGEQVQIYRSFTGNAGDFEELAVVDAADRTFDDESLVTGQTAYYFLRGVTYTSETDFCKKSLSPIMKVETTAMVGQETGTVYFYVRDHLGNSRLVLDAVGNILSGSRFNYEPYGVQLSVSNNPANEKYKFTGQERDYDTGMDYMHFRYYASSMGRFMKPDNLIGNMANPQSWNLYSYVNGNPVNFNDPSGHGPNVRPYPTYMQGTHSWGMTWFDQTKPSGNEPGQWAPWAGQTAGNSWYWGATQDAFHNYVWNQYVLGIGASTNFAPANQVGIGPIGQPLTLTSLLMQLGVTQEELVGAIASVVLAFDYVQHDMPVGSEAAIAIARINGEIKVLIGPASIGGTISQQTILDWRSSNLKTYRAAGEAIEILAFGHVHGPGLWPYPSGDPGDTVNTVNLFNMCSADWLTKYGNMVVLTPEYMWLFNRGCQNWDYAIRP